MRHYLEMCVPMCIGFAVGDLVYFWAAGQFGYSEPFTRAAGAVGAGRDVHDDRPDDRLDALPRHATAGDRGDGGRHAGSRRSSYSALGWLALVPKGDLALLEHGLMMPAMLVPMFLRLDLYTGRSGGPPQARRALRQMRCVCRD